MKLFDAVPNDLFSVLASPNRILYGTNYKKTSKRRKFKNCTAIIKEKAGFERPQNRRRAIIQKFNFLIIKVR